MTTPRRPADAWRGWVAIRPGRFYFCGRIGAAGLHSHHAVQLIAGDGLVLCGADGREHAVEAAVVPANTPHAIVRGTDRGWLALVDPAQAGQLGSGSSSAADWGRDLGVPAADDLPALTALVDAVVRAAAPLALHPALAEAARVVAVTLPGRVRLGDVARAVHLSESRLSHLMKAQFGVPFRSYVLWTRLRAALASLSTGATLTEAAHAAGFADAAHLTRTVRRMMGDAPSVLAAGVRWVP